jgi:hypothetical protein
MKQHSDEAGRTNPQVIQQFDDRDCEHEQPFSGCCFGEKRLGYSYENKLLRTEHPPKQWLVRAAKVQHLV